MIEEKIIVFRAWPWLRPIFGVMLFGLCASMIYRSSWHELPLVLVLVFYWPSTITISESGIRENVGWRVRRFSWSDVCLIERRSRGRVRVVGRNGTHIDFSSHSDPERFLREVRGRATVATLVDVLEGSGFNHLA